MKVIVDTSEPKKYREEFKKYFSDFEVEERSLDIGDTLFDNGLCIERKMTGDLDGSIIDGRAERQMYEMSMNYPLSIIAVVGPIYDPHAYHTLKGRSKRIVGKMASTALFFPNIRLIRVDNNKELFCLMEKLYKNFGEEPNFEMPVRSKYKTKDLQVLMLSAIPGIGIKRAKQILKQESLEELFIMEIDELEDLKGMTPKAAKTLYKVVHDG